MTLECECDRLSACLYAHGGAHLPDVPPAVVVLEAARLRRFSYLSCRGLLLLFLFMLVVSLFYFLLLLLRVFYIFSDKGMDGVELTFKFSLLLLCQLLSLSFQPC